MTAFRICALCLIAALLTVIGGTAWSGEMELISDRESEDVFRVTVSPGVEPFRFNVYYEDFAGFLVVSRMDIYRGDKLLQSLDVDMEEDFGGGDPFYLVDLNNDGYDDIETLAWRGATGNEGWSFWLYNPASDRFDYFDVMCNPSFENDSTITEWADGGAKGHIYRKLVHRSRGGNIVLIRDEKQKIDHDTGRLHNVVTELRDGKMVIVRDMVQDYDKESDETRQTISVLRGGKMVVVREVIEEQHGGITRKITKEPRDGTMIAVREVVYNYDNQLDKRHQVISELRNGKMDVVSDRMLTEDEANEIDEEDYECLWLECDPTVK